jgi:hypothetical protein
MLILLPRDAREVCKQGVESAFSARLLHLLRPVPVEIEVETMQDVRVSLNTCSYSCP